MSVLLSDVYSCKSATNKNNCLKQGLSYILKDITLLCSCTCVLHCVSLCWQQQEMLKVVPWSSFAEVNSCNQVLARL
jgi:hypothetical protein